MNNGQGNASTEVGSYTLGALGPDGVPLDPDSISRSPGAHIVLPTPSEWYKAASYDPATGQYFLYSSGSNTLPAASGPTAAPNSANYNSAVGGLTDVGAYSGTVSPFGAYDMAGNALQWTEAVSQGSAYSYGAAFYSPSDYLVAASSSAWGPPVATNQYGIGFRLVAVPEPSSTVLAGLGGFVLLAWRLRRARWADTRPRT
jgi:hypothetical protein